jgi:hypothetical protein
MFNKRSNYEIINGKGDYVTLLIPAGGGRADLQLRRIDPDKKASAGEFSYSHEWQEPNQDEFEKWL